VKAGILKIQKKEDSHPACNGRQVGNDNKKQDSQSSWE